MDNNNKEDVKPTTQPGVQSGGAAVIGHPMEVAAGPPPPAAVVFMPDFGDDPVTLDCPNCRHKIVSNVSHESKCGTYICCGLLCILFWPLFWLPFCCDGCQEARHTCPSCGYQLGKKVFITS